MRYEFGPDTNGSLKIDLDGRDVGWLVWVGDNSLVHFRSYPQNGLVYWLWTASDPFPAADFGMRLHEGAPPAWHPSMMAFPNSAFGDETVLHESLEIDVRPPQTSYTIVATPDNTPPTQYALIATPGEAYSLQWAASADKPSDQSFFWPAAVPDRSLVFTFQASGSHSFPKGSSFFPVSETQVG